MLPTSPVGIIDTIDEQILRNKYRPQVVILKSKAYKFQLVIHWTLKVTDEIDDH